MTAEQVEQFEKRYGRAPEVMVRAPGRVNLIGEHTDYNEGFVFPVAIDRDTVVLAAKASSHSTVASMELGEGERFDTRILEPGAPDGWAKYPAGMAWAISQEGFGVPPNINALVWSNVPIASGLSSSAAIEMAFGLAYRELGGLGFDSLQLAKLGQVCENRFLGLRSGIMDQLASAMAREGHAMFIDTRSLEIEHALFPGDIAIVVCDTGKARELAGSAYNQRRMQCERAAEIMGVRSLRDAAIDLLESNATKLGDLLYRRARHVITENARCREFRLALERVDQRALFELMQASHVSLRDDYEVSCIELDLMAQAAWEAPGCIGARMTGAGFGGAAVALVMQGKVEAFLDVVARKYQSAAEYPPLFAACVPAGGASLLLGY